MIPWHRLWLCASIMAPAVGIPNIAAADKCLLNWVEREDSLPQGQGAPADPLLARDASRQICGHNTSLLNTYGNKANVLTVTVGGRSLRFVPLGLYHKPDPKHCDRIKIRNACHRIIRSDDGAVSIELSDKDVRSKRPVVFRLSRETIAADGRVTEMQREFALVRANYEVLKKDDTTEIVFLPNEIDNRVAAFQRQADSCKRGRAKSRKCRRGLEAAAEHLALQRLRSERFPSLPREQADRDRAEIGQALGPLSGVHKAIHAVMMRNELGGDKSPYELSDATVANSGISFGVRQLDVGSRNEDAVRIFGINMTEFAQAPDWTRIPRHKRFVDSNSFRAPVRKYTVGQLMLLHEAVPTLNKAMRTPAAKRRYNAHHRAFLDQEARRYAELRRECLFKDSPYLALVAIDRRNQNPGFYKTVRRTVAESCDKATVGQVEQQVADLFGQYVRRSRNIHAVVREEGLR